MVELSYLRRGIRRRRATLWHCDGHLADRGPFAATRNRPIELKLTQLDYA
jgi:hypothetical protein